MSLEIENFVKVGDEIYSEKLNETVKIVEIGTTFVLVEKNEKLQSPDGRAGTIKKRVRVSKDGIIENFTSWQAAEKAVEKVVKSIDASTRKAAQDKINKQKKDIENKQATPNPKTPNNAMKSGETAEEYKARMAKEQGGK